MSLEGICPLCNSNNIEPGAIQSTGRIYFRPENTKFFTLSTNDVPVNANMCMECGHIMLVGDLHKANKLLKMASPH